MRDIEKNEEKILRMFKDIFDLEDQVISCDTCADQLSLYVDLELDGEDPVSRLPALSQHLAHCPDCRLLYRQVREILELERKGELVEPPAYPVFDLGFFERNWFQQVTDWGRAWLERETGRWRQLTLLLPTLADRRQGAPALAGLMRDTGETPTSIQRTVAPEGAGFELKLVIGPDTTSTGEGLQRLEVALTLLDRLGDFSGARVSLSWGNTTRAQETDALGKVVFTGLPADQMAFMSLTVTLPD